VAEPLLDDPAALAAGDPQGLVASYLTFGDQLLRAYQNAAEVTIEAGAARAAVFCGMGGSAAAGDLVTAAYAADAPVAISVRRGYALPAWIGRDTLVICLSYSGNTEETVAAYEEAAARGAHLVTISAGGELASRAARDGNPHLAIAPDSPQPRAALGSLTGAAIGVLVAAGVLEDAPGEIADAQADLQTPQQESGADVPADRNRAKQVAEFVGSRVPVVWGSEGVSWPAAWRWKCGFNENAKIPAFASALPELDHHEVVGWTKGHADAFCLVVLREPGEHASVQTRLDATLPEIRAADVEVLEVRSESARSPLARGLELMLIGDVASAYHGIAHGIDPAPIEAIARVKARLSEGR
jgi:glucose/mannose-6-phosphate isomerase